MSFQEHIKLRGKDSLTSPHGIPLSRIYANWIVRNFQTLCHESTEIFVRHDAILFTRQAFAHARRTLHNMQAIIAILRQYSGGLASDLPFPLPVGANLATKMPSRTNRSRAGKLSRLMGTVRAPGDTFDPPLLRTR